MTKNKINYFLNDDYASLDIGCFGFYYGHEYTIPDMPKDEDPDDDIDYKWAFVVTKNNEILLKVLPEEFCEYLDDYRRSDFEKDVDALDVQEVLIAGIGIVLHSLEFRAKQDFDITSHVNQLLGFE